jgi:osmoprotectant transport system substrate-binding protein
MSLRRVMVAAATLLVGILSAVALAACSTSAFSGSSTASKILRPADSKTDKSARNTTTAATTTTATQPQVTEVTTTPTTTATTATGTSTVSQLPGYKKAVIQLGDMNTTEQFILGELYAIALKHQGYTVVISPNIGSTQTSIAALQQGSLMVYPEYLNVWDSDVAHDHHTFKDLEDAWQAGDNYAQHKGWELLDPTPFSNTVGVAVSSQYARVNDLYSLTQLNNGPGITVGWPPEPDALPDLQKLESAYDFMPASKRAIDIGSQYSSLTNGSLQAAYVNTTDPQLTGTGYVLLHDPLRIFGFGNVVPVTTRKVINEEGPSFEQTLDQVDALLTQSAIRGLNYQVAIQHQSPQAVADQFLQGNGIIPATTYAPVTTATTASTTATGTTTSAR